METPPLGRYRLSRRALNLGAAATVAGIATSACTGGDDEETPEGNGQPDQVTALTGFAAFGRDAYFWVAKEKGFFSEENIDLTIEPGPGTALNIAEVVAGSADFCVGDMTGSLIVYSDGAEGAEEFIIVGAIHQLAPISVVFRADSGIRNPTDLEGRVIGDAPGSVGQLLFPAYAAVVGIDPDSVEFFQADPPQLPGLLASGDVDAVNQFIFGLPTVENAVGAPVDYFIYGEDLPELFGNAIITRRELAASNPDLVRRFSAALLRGLEYALDNPEEAGEIINGDVPEVDPAGAAAEVELMEPYVRQPGVTVGSIDEVRVSQAIALIESVGGIRAGIQAEDVIDFSLVPAGSEEG
jgi:NitT/TauT family transport system substrate-binding protein